MDRTDVPPPASAPKIGVDQRVEFEHRHNQRYNPLTLVSDYPVRVDNRSAWRVRLHRLNTLLGARLRLIPPAGSDDLAVNGLEVRATW
jgi:hypothetical protein